MKCENAANINEFAGKVLHHAGWSDPPAVLSIDITPVNSKIYNK